MPKILAWRKPKNQKDVIQLKEKPKNLKKMIEETWVTLYAATNYYRLKEHEYQLILGKGIESRSEISWDSLKDQFLKRYQRSPLFRIGLKKWKGASKKP